MPAHIPRQKCFLVTNPDALLKRRHAVNLIRRHADEVRVLEDLGGHWALMVADGNALRLVLFSDLSDAQIELELQEAWRRQHDQADLFRDIAPESAFWNWLR
jgi:hypothetical protein